MKKVDVLKFFGGSNATAAALGLSIGTVSMWPEIIPDRHVIRIHLISGKTLDMGMSDYSYEAAPRPELDESAA